MAELVNQRIQEMINELEQMRRTNLYDDDEIREISRKRKEFEYRIQRRVKQKDDFVHYIAYELALLEDVALRRKQAKLTEKKKDIEYTIAKRLNKIFKKFIYRFQNDVEIYFQYIKFCKSVGFTSAVSGIIGQMLLVHGDKPKMWQMASKWELKEQNNLEFARTFLLKGIHRHPESDILYLDLFNIELSLAYKAEEEEREKVLKRADIVWRTGVENVNRTSFLFQLCDLSLKHEIAENITNSIKEEIWNNRKDKDVWPYIAAKELEGCQWKEIEEFVDEDYNFPEVMKNYMAVYEAALQQFSDEKLCTKYIHGLLSLNESVCSDQQRISAVKHAWMYGHENGLLTNDMYAFGIEMLKVENEMSREELMEIIDTALQRSPKIRYIWEEKLMLNKAEEKKMFSILQDATKKLSFDDALYLWNLMLDNIDNNVMIKNFYKKFQKCDSQVLLAVKPKLLQKSYEYNGLKAAREIYEEFIRTPPIQMEVHKVMIEIEKSQEKVNMKSIRRCYECAVQHYGTDSVEIWNDYIKFETERGSAQAVPAIYRRAMGMLKKELVDDFIKAQTMAKLNSVSLS